MTTLKIGLFGFGCVGQGLYYALQNSTGFKTQIDKIVVKNKKKKRSLNRDLFSFDKNDILENPEINVVVELIDDAEEAFNIVSTALQKGKHVVTANKKMLALHLEKLVKLSREHQVSLLYEAAACGSIPIMRSLEEYFGNEQLNRIVGIFNGTTNYILTRIADENLAFADALRNAQELGFAESNPKNDVEAFDPLYKAIVLAFHGFGIILQPDGLLRFGISALKEGDIEFAAKHNYRTKLVASIQRITQNSLSAYVIPCFIDSGHKLAMVNNEFNGVIVEGSFSGEQFFVGKGAGSFPTGAAVLSDLSALSFNYAYENKKYKQAIQPEITHDFNLKIYVSSTNVEDIELFPFELVEENHQKNDFNYRIGDLRASELAKLKHVIEQRKIFIAMI